MRVLRIKPFDYSHSTAGTIRAMAALTQVIAKQTIAAHTECISGHLHGKHFLLLDVVVDGAAIYIHDFRGPRDPNHLHILFTALTPDLFPKDERRL